MDSFAHVSAATDIGRYTRLRADARADQDAAFKRVAQEFEALFIQMMLKSARDASMDGGLFSSREMELYREMFDSQVALSMAERGGIGLEAVMRRQMGLAADSDAPTEELRVPERRAFPVRAAPVSAPPFADPFASRIGETAAAAARTPASGEAFASSVRPLAAEAGAKLGIDGELLIAQAALETGWGRHVMRLPNGDSSHNYFGIKAGANWHGKTVDVDTMEFIDGRALTVRATFRAYPDAGAAFDDYVKFVAAQPRYEKAVAHAGDPERYIRELARAGYATDPRYAEKILALRDQIAETSQVALW